MEDKKQPEIDSQELLEKLKLVFIIYDYIKTKSENIDEFNLSKIYLSNDIRHKGLVKVFQFFKYKKYPRTSNLNRKTKFFISLIEKIFNSYPKSKIFDLQLSLAYNLIYMYHKDIGKDDKKEYKKSFTTYLSCSFKNNICLQYLNILKQIDLLKKESVNDSDTQFSNKCEMIINLNRTEFNSSIFRFILMNDQYKKIKFPRLLINDDESIYNKKIEDISTLLDVIKASSKMNKENIRFELFEKYMNQLNKLDAINQVLSCFNKRELISLSEGEFEQYIELRLENALFLKKEEQKRENTLYSLNNQLTICRQLLKKLLDNLKNAEIELMHFQKMKKEMRPRYESQEKDFNNLYAKFQNVK